MADKAKAYMDRMMQDMDSSSDDENPMDILKQAMGQRVQATRPAAALFNEAPQQVAQVQEQPKVVSAPVNSTSMIDDIFGAAETSTKPRVVPSSMFDAAPAEPPQQVFTPPIQEINDAPPEVPQT